MRWAVIAVALSTACGRLDFGPASPVADATDAADAADGRDGGDGSVTAAPSCAGLPSTCGATRTESCCTTLLVPGGSYLRGYDTAIDAMFPDMTHPATVSAFMLDKYEITVGRFRAFVDAGMGTRTNPPAAGTSARTLNGQPAQGGWDPSWSSQLAVDAATLRAALRCDAALATWTDAPGASEDRPMNCINWYEAFAFCAWDGGFLPTESEWMYAAAGGDEQRAYPFSNPPGDLGIAYTNASYNCMGGACGADNMLVPGSLPAGDGRWGHSDLAGNVFEWTLDWGGVAYQDPCVDCANLTDTGNRSIRGGGFDDTPATLRVGHREAVQPQIRLADSSSVRCARAP